MTRKKTLNKQIPYCPSLSFIDKIKFHLWLNDTHVFFPQFGLEILFRLLNLDLSDMNNIESMVLTEIFY